MESVLAIINLLILGVLAVIGWFLRDAPKLLRELEVEKKRGENQKNLQVESYFREISGEDLNGTLRGWTSLIDTLGDKKIKEKEIEILMKKLTSDTFMYGSAKTTKILALMQQNVYDHEKNGQGTNYHTMVYVSLMVASLKEDFTGEKVDSLDFLRLRLNDFNDEEMNKKLVKIEKEILKELKNNGYDWNE